MIAVVAIKVVEIIVTAKLRLTKKAFSAMSSSSIPGITARMEVIIPDRKRGMNSVQRAFIHNGKNF